MVIPENASRSQQRECQRKCQINNNEENIKQFMDTHILAQLANVKTIRYIDDKVETYETQVTRRISELMDDQEIKSSDGRQRLVGCDEMR